MWARGTLQIFAAKSSSFRFLPGLERQGLNPMRSTSTFLFAELAADGKQPAAERGEGPTWRRRPPLAAAVRNSPSAREAGRYPADHDLKQLVASLFSLWTGISAAVPPEASIAAQVRHAGPTRVSTQRRPTSMVAALTASAPRQQDSPPRMPRVSGPHRGCSGPRDRSHPTSLSRP